MMVHAALVGHWKLDETSGTTLLDSSGSGNCGNLCGPFGDPTLGASGKIGNAADWTALNQCITVPDSASLSITGDITISAWVNLDNTTTWRSIISKSNGNLPAPYDLYVNQGSKQLNFWRGNGVGSHQSISGTTNLNCSLGTWIHLVATMCGTAANVYLNGACDGSGNITATVADQNTDVKIGNRDDGVTDMLGSLDDVAIWNESMTADEIKSLHDIGNNACLSYHASNFESLKQIHDAGTGSVVICGTTWAYSNTLSCTAGLNVCGSSYTLVMNAGSCTGMVSLTNLYWDDNGTTAGAGTTPTDVWSAASTKWNASSAGTACSFAWASNANAYFSAGGDACGAYTITVCGNQSVSSLNFEEGCPTLTGGTITMGGCAPAIDVACGRTATIVSTLAGSCGFTKTGAGTVSFTGSITLTGDININAGTVSRTGAWCVCNGATHTVRCGADLLGNTTINVGRCSTGTLTVTGCGSTAGNTGDSIIVGRNCGSNGTLNVLSQADVTATTFLFVGRCSGSVGVVNVDGNGSTLTVGSGVRLGRSSSNANVINVTNCGNLSSCSSFIIGQFGCSNGTLNVSSGGDVSMTTLTIGSGCGSTGAVNLSGCGSTICASGTVSVGRSAGGSTASLTLNAGGVITAPTITVYSGGSVTVNADERIADATNITLSGGTLTLAANVEETVDTVSLSSSSSVVYNTQADFTMDDFSMTAGQVLTITGWTNWTRYGSGQGLGTSFRVNNYPGTHDPSNISVNGSTGVFDFIDGGDGYYYLVLTTPEPSTYVGIAGALLLVAFHFLRRIRVKRSYEALTSSIAAKSSS